METDKHLDWISLTLPDGTDWQGFIPLADWRLKGKGRHGYRELWIDRKTGATCETLANQQYMGSHISLSGNTLLALRLDLDLPDNRLVARIVDYHAKISRLDCCIDVWASTLSPARLAEALTANLATISARTWRLIDGHSQGIGGFTLDTGSPTSDRRLRFYDKRAEQRIKDGASWVRFEIQLRRVYARAAMDMCHRDGVEPTTTALIRDYLAWENVEYSKALTGVTLHPPEIPRKPSKRQDWLLTQVAKALADEIRETAGFRDRFNRAVDRWIDPSVDNLTP